MCFRYIDSILETEVHDFAIDNRIAARWRKADSDLLSSMNEMRLLMDSVLEADRKVTLKLHICKHRRSSL